MKLTDVIDHYAIDCENRGHAKGTLANYRRWLGLLVQWLEQGNVTEVESVTLPLLRQFLHYLMTSDSSRRFPDAVQQGKLAASTVCAYVSAIKAFFQWCVAEDLLASSPAARLQKPKIPARVRPTFTQEHIDRLLACCDVNTRPGYRNRVMLLVLLDTGIRVSELCSLRLVDVHQRYIKVNGKGQKEREIGLHPDVSKELWKFISKHRGAFLVESECVFVGEKGPLTVDGVETIFDKLEKESGIRDMRVTPHVFRHTHSKEYLKQGGDLFKLSRELGHSSVQITGNIYLSDFKSVDAVQDHDRFSAINNMKVRSQSDGNKKKRGKKERRR